MKLKTLVAVLLVVLLLSMLDDYLAVCSEIVQFEIESMVEVENQRCLILVMEADAVVLANVAVIVVVVVVVVMVVVVVVEMAAVVVVEPVARVNVNFLVHVDSSTGVAADYVGC